MSLEIYKKIEQSKKNQDRSTALNETELTAINTINENFVAFFKNKHLS